MALRGDGGRADDSAQSAAPDVHHSDPVEVDHSDTLVVDVRGLVKSYSGTQAVRGIDLTIRKGEVFALLGPNGAGKTTTVEILEGYRTRDHGEVSVLGLDPGRQRAKLKSRMGIVFSPHPARQ
jgi:ABC-type multidrug transport system ATPase subunit